MKFLLSLLISLSAFNCINDYQQRIQLHTYATVGIKSAQAMGVGVILESSKHKSYILTVAHLCNPEIYITHTVFPQLGIPGFDVDKALKTMANLSQSKTFCDAQIIVERSQGMSIYTCKAEFIDFDRDLMLCSVNADLGINIQLGTNQPIGSKIHLVMRNSLTASEAVILYSNVGNAFKVPPLAHTKILKLQQVSFPVGVGASGSSIFDDLNMQLVGLLVRCFFSSDDDIKSSIHVNLMIPSEILKEFLSDWHKLRMLANAKTKCLGNDVICRFVLGQATGVEFMKWLEEDLIKGITN